MTGPALSPGEWAVAGLAAVCIGLSKSGFGGVGIVAIVGMAAILPPRESTGTILPMLICADVFAVWQFRRHVQWRYVFRTAIPAILGVLAGFWLMPAISDAAFGPFIGWLTLALIGMLILLKANAFLRNLPLRYPAVFGWPMGFLAGATTMLANAAGPVMSVYLLASRLPKMEFVGTAAWFFFAINLFKVPFSAALGLIHPQSLTLNLCLLPGVVAGVFLGKLLLGKISQTFFEWLMLGFAILGGLKLVIFG
ncbi:MAG TPA: sulfite exporter TauE/SafE family protein [Chthoniobacterales bacterium]